MAYLEILDTINGLPGESVRLYASNVVFSGQKNVEDNPNANIDGPTDVQTLAFKNPLINVQRVQMVNESGSVNYEDLLRWYKHKYTGLNKLFLRLNIKGTNVWWPDLNLNTAFGIPVVLKDFKIDFSAKESDGGYMPQIDLTFIETK